MEFLGFLKENIVLLDGGMGTLLQSQGLLPGELPERWNLSHPDAIRAIHKAYFDAGSHVVSTNTFGANALKFSDEELDDLVRSAVENASFARSASEGEQEKFIALDIGPSGKMLKPYGDLDFEDAVELFAKTVRLGVKYGVDLILIETMSDSYETKAALLAAKENSDLPVIVSNAYGEDQKLMTGADPAAMVAMLEGMHANVLGVNCSLGPKQLSAIVQEYLARSSVPVLLMPNAGIPRCEDGKTVFDVTPEEFAEDVYREVQRGVRVVGGCCGTTPAHIRALSMRLCGVSPLPITQKDVTCVSSYTHSVSFGDCPILIGERINPTGKKALKEALFANDIDYLLREATEQQARGVQVLDVNVGLPEIDEVKMLETAVCGIQAVSDLPLQIDTAAPSAMETAMRRYNGKAMVNSVSGKQASMHAIFPLVQKYGGVVVALTLDEDGIPETVGGRVAIAKRIIETAKTYGIAKKDLIFDTLTMPISADPSAASVTLEALCRIRTELGCHTLLGVSNISFGLPNRDVINSTFFAMALARGLDAAIMNPYSADMMRTYYAFSALANMDANCGKYIAFSETYTPQTLTRNSIPIPQHSQNYSDLQKAIVQGRKEQAQKLTADRLCSMLPLDIVKDEIIPALDIVGSGFEKNTVFLPQLLMSAEAAKSAFEVIKRSLAAVPEVEEKGTVVLATVRGDIHDIGKNIVKLLLENYGFSVIDLGKDVPPEAVVRKVQEKHAPLVGLSALMTTTVPAMEETIRQLRLDAPWCKIVVGGAVLTKAYAAEIGADHYAGDAMETVRFAEQILAEKS